MNIGRSLCLALVARFKFQTPSGKEHHVSHLEEERTPVGTCLAFLPGLDIFQVLLSFRQCACVLAWKPSLEGDSLGHRAG